MPAISSHPRKQGNRTIKIEKHHRMPRRRPALEDIDEEIYQLEREIITYRRWSDEFRGQAQSYRDVGLLEYAERTEAHAGIYDKRIEELQAQIRELRQRAVFKGVQE